MKYKALMLDVDGTLVPYDYNALPSEKVRQAIKRAQEKGIIVSIVTGREYSFIRAVLKALDIHKGYAVVNTGANVVEIETEKLLYDQPIERKDTEEITEILLAENIPFYVKQSYDDRAVLTRGAHKKGEKIEKAYMFFVMEQYPQERIDGILKKLSHISTITLTKANHSLPNSYGLGITHVKATKLHGVEVVMKKLGLKREELIGVGDSYNDFPLLMSCGLKVAMGNAIPDLKAIADYVAPSVTDDGVADVIEKYILSSSRA